MVVLDEICRRSKILAPDVFAGYSSDEELTVFVSDDSTLE